jgi:tetratricopeptide (TPR) repeat protein
LEDENQFLEAIRMERFSPGLRLGAVVAFSWVWIVLAGCGPRLGGYPESVIDTTEHHIYNGFMFIKLDKVDDAQREFERALSLAPKSSAANRGMGIVYGMKKDFRSAFRYMDWAENYAEKKHEKAMAYVGMMNLYTLQREAGWLGKVEGAYNQALSSSADLPEAYFQLGMAYKHAYLTAESKLAFEKVLEMNESLVTEAEEQLSTIKKIEKAMPRSDPGKEIALLDRITRADGAVLLIEETGIAKMLKSEESRTGERPAWTRDKPVSLPPDVVNHPMRDDIAKVVELGIQGLKTFHDGTFRPDQYMRRADFAMVVADIIARRGGESSSGQKSREAVSPFKDVRTDAPYFNAVMVAAVHAKVMEAEGGVFNPMGTLSGIEALMILRNVEKTTGRNGS